MPYIPGIEVVQVPGVAHVMVVVTLTVVYEVMVYCAVDAQVEIVTTLTYGPGRCARYKAAEPYVDTVPLTALYKIH